MVLDCPQHQHVWATACAKAANAVGVIGIPAAAGWSALGLASQQANLLSSEERFPLEVESRLRGVATKALVDGFHKVDVDLNLGHAALREEISAEVQRVAAMHEAAKADWGSGSSPRWAGPPGITRGPCGPPPASNRQGFQQAAQACAPHGVLQGPAVGVPLARKAGPQPKVRRAGPSCTHPCTHPQGHSGHFG